MAAVYTNRQGTLLGPLTTTWSMPESCKVHVVNCATCGEGYRGQQCAIRDEKGGPDDHTDCWPPVTQRAGTPTAPFHGWGFYSPGLACPTGYTAACTAEYGGRSDWEVEFTLIAGETAIGCCPTGFRCTNHNGNSCIAIEPELTAQTGSCLGTELVNLGQVTYPVFIDITTTITEATSTGGAGEIAVQTSKPFTLLAPMFQLNYRSSDLASSTTTPLTTGPSTSDSTTSIASQSTNSDTSSSDSSAPAADEGGLSTGAIVGIGVGAALGGILLGVLAILLFVRNRRRKRAEAAAWTEAQGRGGGDQQQQQQYDYKYPAEMLVPNQQIPAEIWGQPTRVEMTGSEPTLAEMGGTSNHGQMAPPAELPTGNAGRWSHGNNHTPTTPYYD